MILCKKAEGTDGYFIQVEGTAIEATVEAVHILHAIYDNVGEEDKKGFRRAITAAVTGGPGENIWDAQAEATSINLSSLPRRRKTEGEGEQRHTGKS